MRQPINGSLAGRLLARVFLVSLLLAGSTGCVGAMLMVPGLAGVGAGGYLWGKEATRDKTPDTENVDAGAAVLRSGAAEPAAK
jgi:hypothetical protein